MSLNILGIDIGSVSIAIAEINSKKEIVKKSYCFHKGDIQKELKKELKGYDLKNIKHVAATSSTPDIVARDIDFDNQVAFITAAREIHVSFDSILAVGGEKFGHLVFNDLGEYKSYKTNTSCAAGTGSFLDQQAGRLNLDGIEELSKTAYENKKDYPLIASRCAVFAKTDLIHAQQEGYTLSEISDGLCYGLAKNITDTLFASEKPKGKIIFCGGVSKNMAVKEHIEKLADIDLMVDEYSNIYGALGVCYCVLEEIEKGSNVATGANDSIFVKKIKNKELHYGALELKLSDYPDFSSLEQYKYDGKESRGNLVETDIYEDLESLGNYNFWFGVDIGSTSTKAVLINDKKDVIAGFYTRTAGNPLKAIKLILETVNDIEEKKGIKIDIKGCGTTGSGRKFIGKIIGCDMAVDEITAHARAASEINPDVDTIIEIGGQDAKFTTLKNGVVNFSTMNNVCAAGTGSFIEEQAKKLGCSIKDYAKRTESVFAPMSSDRCTVFMERDINHYLCEGYDVDEVLASVLHSVRENYLVKVATESLIGDEVYFQGATAKNRSLVAAFEQRLNKPIQVSKFCHLTGALGTALIVMEEHKDESVFRGIGIYNKDIPLNSEICSLCNNNCKIIVADIEGDKVAYGFLCGRDYETKKYVKKSSEFELLKVRKKIEKSFETKSDTTSSPVIGIPAALHLVEDLGFWKFFFNELNIKTISSEKYGEGVKNGKKLTTAEFCAPATAMFGHVEYLKGKSDFVFLPFYLEDKSKGGRRQYCYYTQYTPSMIGKVEDKKILTPLVNYLYTNFHTRMELYKTIKKIGLKKSFFEISSAYDKAVDFKKRCKKSFENLYTNSVKNSDDINIVLLGRPYTILLDKMNNKIPDIFSNLGIKSFFHDMVPVSRDESKKIEPLLSDIHWKHPANILKVAEKVAQSDNVYPVYVTSFKCSPDSFGIRFFKELMEKHEKPYLILELDEHDSSVGYETRIEAAVRAFRNDLAIKKEKKNPDYSSLFFKSAKNFKNKNLVFPNWDSITCRFLTAALKREGINTYLIEESESTILKSMKFNTGQCVPANSIAQGFVETIEKNRLDPQDTVLWMTNINFCNIALYPNFIKSLLSSYGNGMEKAEVCKGDFSLLDISMRASMNAYFAHMFGGMIRKMGCKIRPYEVDKGQTDKVIEESVDILEEAFLGKRSKNRAVAEVVAKFEGIEIIKEKRPKVAIFGDFYVRDNHIMNQDLVRFIEENGGEVITTPYSEMAKMIAPMYYKKWFNEGLYLNIISCKALEANMKLMEKKYMKYFNRVILEDEHSYNDDPEKILAKFNIRKENVGESVENTLKIHYLTKYHEDLSLFVQANPAFCCPSLVTEAMKKDIEEKTSVPVVTITYDGTGGIKNQSVIPYLKYSKVNSEKEIPLKVS